MGLNTIPAVAGLTRNIQAFTSSTTWTVPSTAQYVDVLVVGGGTGGRGGSRRTNANCDITGSGGAITIGKNIYLGGTGTVSITVGAGTAGSTGTSTTSRALTTGSAGHSAFGTFIFSGGATGDHVPGWPGYKGTQNPTNLIFSATVDNDLRGLSFFNYGGYGLNAQTATGVGFGGSGLDVIGLSGGIGGEWAASSTAANVAGGIPGGGFSNSTNDSRRLATIPTLNWFNVNSYIGSATAGTTGGSGGTAGPAGVKGLAGGGGASYFGTGQHGQGGPGAGGGGGHGGAQLGGTGNGGTGGNAGTNTGAGGGAGGDTGSASAGTGGNGGNGAAGIVLVSWLG